MSTGAHFCVKIGHKLQSMGKISNISAADPPQFFWVNSNTTKLEPSLNFRIFLNQIYSIVLSTREFKCATVCRHLAKRNDASPHIEIVDGDYMTISTVSSVVVEFESF